MLWRRKAGTVGRLEPDHNDQVKKSEPYSVDLKLTLWSKRCVCVCVRAHAFTHAHSVASTSLLLHGL